VKDISMFTKQFPKSLLAFIFLILIFQAIAIIFYWYWRIWWFDMPMHFLGGLWVGLSVLWFVFLSKRLTVNIPQTAFSTFVTGVLLVFIVAIVWEIFEYVVQVFIPREIPYDILDTLSDIFWGLMGGVTASFSFSRKRYLEKQ